MNAPKLKDSALKEVRLRLDAQVSKAAKMIEDLEEFSFEGFETGFIESNVHLKSNSFMTLFERYIND